MALSRLFIDWLDEAGAQVPNAQLNGQAGELNVEISPLFALDAEELKEKVPLPLDVTAGLYLE